MSARDDLVSVASSDMPVTSDEVNEAINAYKRELLGVDPACSADYLRKRFSEAIEESEFGWLLGAVPEEQAESMVTELVRRLLLEAGVEY